MQLGPGFPGRSRLGRVHLGLVISLRRGNGGRDQPHRQHTHEQVSDKSGGETAETHVSQLTYFLETKKGGNGDAFSERPGQADRAREGRFP